MDLIKIYAGIVGALILIDIIAIFFASPSNTGMPQEEIDQHAKNSTLSLILIVPLILRCLEVI